MAAGRTRSTRKLRAWIVEQVCSGKYPGLVWDDEAKTMFRIPWKHAGKQDFRKDEDAAIFKAWADFKGKLSDGSGDDSPASWKTRLRCALNKSTEFQEVAERAQLDISEPYKVYRLVPPAEQGFVTPEKKCRAKAPKRQRSRRRRTSHSDSDHSEDDEPCSRGKLIKTEQEMSSPPEYQNFPQDAAEPMEQSDLPDKPEEFQYTIEFTNDGQTDGFTDSPLYRLCPTAAVDEITLDVRIEENVPAPAEAQDSFHVGIRYLGQEVLQRHVHGTDVRILYPSSSLVAPVPAALGGGCFPRILLPEPPATLPPSEEQRALFTLLPFMERGVALTSTPKGIYGRRFCQGRVFWTGPHTTAPGLHKMERNTDPVLLFSKEVFKQQLENFHANGGEPPQCSITLCFGEELSTTDDLASKLVIVQVTLPWAEQQVHKSVSIQGSISLLQSLASQSPLGEITLNLVALSPLAADGTEVCGLSPPEPSRHL